MGALDKRIFSGVAIVAALLFVVSAVMLFISDAELTADDNSTALYILTVAGILAIVYSAPTIINGESFVRKISSILVAITGVLFIATAFSGSSAPTVIAAAGIVAGLALVADMLALWVSRIYGAMYVSAILAAVDLVMGVMCLIKGYDGTFVLGLLVAFAAWLAIGTWIALFVKTDSAPKTREVIEAATSSKKEKPQAQNKKATPKAKKVEPKKEDTPAEEPKAPVEEMKEEPKKVRTVELPKTPKTQEAIQKTQEPKREESAPKQEQKAPSKAMGDFMSKLMNSKDANEVTKQTDSPKQVETPVVKVEEPKKEDTPAEEPKAPVEEPAEAPAEDVPEVPEVTVPDEPYESVIAAPVEPKKEISEFHTAEPDWGLVSKDSSVSPKEARKDALVEKAEEPKKEETPAEEPKAPVEEPAEAPAEDVPEVPEVTVPDEPYESVIAAPVEPKKEISEFHTAEPDWGLVSKDSSVSPKEARKDALVEKAEEPKKEETPAEEPKAPVEEPAEAPAEEPKVEEPVAEDVPVAPVATPVSVPDEPYESVISEQIQTRDDEEKPAEPEPDWGKVTEDSMASSDPEEGEDDLYTDNSPEARVRRAAWNKNLRCRRGYGPHNIPVAFVKAKVAVYVDEPGADTSVDEELRAEGWEVLRFNAADVTDGKDECEKICAVVKPRTKTTKKKSKK
ncbi:hypothetical protein [Candidatus Methanoprimaticola sp. MG2]|uniref:hypothetical protein n=1 Tax=Candidatus Methanoprimaticola sp. MG2 TaxID=3228838 RepID=UPI0039C6A0F6